MIIKDEAIKMLDGLILDTPKEIEALSLLLDIAKRIEVKKIEEIIDSIPDFHIKVENQIVNSFSEHDKIAQAIVNYLTEAK